jgi:hypothetical protein
MNSLNPSREGKRWRFVGRCSPEGYRDGSLLGFWFC